MFTFVMKLFKTSFRAVACIFMLWLLVHFVACKIGEYKEDFGFMVSAQANSPEFPVLVKGLVCKDLEGVVGVCSIRIPETENFELVVMAQQYDYEYAFNCSKNVTGAFPIKEYVKAGVIKKLVVLKEAFPIEKTFNCSIIIKPTDRPEPISSFAKVNVIITQAGYQGLERPYKDGKYFVFGEHAKYIAYKVDNEWKYAQEKAYIRKTNIQEAFIESYAGRHGYYHE